MATSIRLAKPADIAALADVERRADEAFDQYPGLILSRGETASSELLEDACRNVRLWVADDENGLTGFAFALVIDGEAHLEQLSVVPEHQGRGLGSRLLETVVDWASTEPFQYMTLSTFRNVPWNAPFYERRRFVAMDKETMTPGLLQLRRNEIMSGLDVETRLFMRRMLNQ